MVEIDWKVVFNQMVKSYELKELMSLGLFLYKENVKFSKSYFWDEICWPYS